MATRTIPEVGTPAGRRAAAQAALLAHRLLTLDTLWTGELESWTGDRSEADFGVLEDLVTDMREGLSQIGDHAYEVRMMIDEQLSDETFGRALDTIAQLPTAPSDLHSILSSALPDYEPRSATIVACDYIRETARAESDLLSEKLSALRAGETPSGDFRMPFTCAALLMLVGAGVAGTIGLGGAPLFVGLTVGSQVGLGALGWVQGRCPGLLPEIGFGRR